MNGLFVVMLLLCCRCVTAATNRTHCGTPDAVITPRVVRSLGTRSFVCGVERWPDDPNCQPDYAWHATAHLWLDDADKKVYHRLVYENVGVPNSFGSDTVIGTYIVEDEQQDDPRVIITIDSSLHEFTFIGAKINDDTGQVAVDDDGNAENAVEWNGCDRRDSVATYTLAPCDDLALCVDCVNLVAIDDVCESRKEALHNRVLFAPWKPNCDFNGGREVFSGSGERVSQRRSQITLSGTPQSATAPYLPVRDRQYWLNVDIYDDARVVPAAMWQKAGTMTPVPRLGTQLPKFDYMWKLTVPSLPSCAVRPDEPPREYEIKILPEFNSPGSVNTCGKISITRLPSSAAGDGAADDASPNSAHDDVKMVTQYPPDWCKARSDLFDGRIPGTTPTTFVDAPLGPMCTFAHDSLYVQDFRLPTANIDTNTTDDNDDDDADNDEKYHFPAGVHVTRDSLFDWQQGGSGTTAYVGAGGETTYWTDAAAFNFTTDVLSTACTPGWPCAKAKSRYQCPGATGAAGRYYIEPVDPSASRTPGFREHSILDASDPTTPCTDRCCNLRLVVIEDACPSRRAALDGAVYRYYRRYSASAAHDDVCRDEHTGRMANCAAQRADEERKFEAERKRRREELARKEREEDAKQDERQRHKRIIGVSVGAAAVVCVVVTVCYFRRRKMGNAGVSMDAFQPLA